MEWQAEQAMKCDGCGFPLDISTDPERLQAWIAEPVTCGACAARERKAKAMRDGGGQIDPGTRFRVRDRSDG